MPSIPGPWLTRWKKLAAIRNHELGLPNVPGWNAYGWRFDHATRETFAAIRLKAGLGHRPDGRDGMLDGKLRRYLKGARIPASVPASTAPPMIGNSVPTHGSFGPGEPHYFVVHSTSGYGSVEGLAAFFRQGSLGVQWAIDGDGRIGRYAPGEVTWHVKNHNSECEGVELVGFAVGETDTHGHTWTTTDWLARRDQLDALSWLIAYRVPALGLPIVRASNGDERGFVGSRGIVGHINVPDNDHTDPGVGFPWDLVLKQATAWHAHGVPAEVATRIRAANKKV